MGIKQELRELKFRAFKKAKFSGAHIPDETRAAVSAFVDSCLAEYDSPEAQAERERAYQERCRIGELRRRAIEIGQDPDKVAPFPNCPNHGAKYHPGMSIQEQVDAFINGNR